MIRNRFLGATNMPWPANSGDVTEFLRAADGLSFVASGEKEFFEAHQRKGFCSNKKKPCFLRPNVQSKRSVLTSRCVYKMVEVAYKAFCKPQEKQ